MALGLIGLVLSASGFFRFQLFFFDSVGRVCSDCRSSPRSWSLGLHAATYNLRSQPMRFFFRHVCFGAFWIEIP